MIAVEWDGEGVLRRLAGAITLEALEASDEAIESDPRLDTVRYLVHDFSEVTSAAIPPDAIEYLACRAGIALRRNAFVKLAYVGSHPLATQLREAFHATGCSPLRIAQFDTLEQARRYVSATAPV